MDAVRLETVTAREIFDGRGTPTVEVTARLTDGSTGVARVAGGDPEELRETRELRDGDPRRHRGLGVLRAVRGIRGTIAPALVGSHPGTLREADHLLRELDSTPDCSRLGANALMGVSLACGKALAAHYGMELYRFLGGECTGRLPLPWVPFPWSGGQGYWVPVGAGGVEEGFRWCLESGARLDAPEGLTPERQLAQAVAALESAGHAGRVKLALRPAGHFQPGAAGYRLPGVGEALSPEEMADHWAALAERFPLWEVIDPLAPEDAESWGELEARLRGKVRLAGETCARRGAGFLRQSLGEGIFRDVALHPHHFGTVTDLLERAREIREAGAGVVLAAAPGETEDDAWADLAVALGAGQAVLGPPRGAEHLSKVNRLLALERG